MTCGRNSRTSRTSGSAASSSFSSAKHPSGSGGSGSPSGSPESVKPRNRCCTPRISLALAISSRRIRGRLARTSGRSIALLRISPRSPPVRVATMTSAPERTYRTIVAAPLLDSSSGCACTASRRSPAYGKPDVAGGAAGAARPRVSSRETAGTEIPPRTGYGHGQGAGGQVIAYWRGQRRVIILHDSAPDTRTYSRALSQQVIDWRGLTPHPCNLEELPGGHKGNPPIPMGPGWLHADLTRPQMQARSTRDRDTRGRHLAHPGG